tara:strand:+ start:4105 stop:5718 length:1614 start_codon:yes stop_codon:yes gene_type:complete
MKSKFKNIMIILILISFSLGQTGNDEYNLRKQAEIYYQQKKYDDALEIYLNIFNQNPTSYEYLRKLKNILTQKKEYSQLINCYNKFISSTTNKKLIFEAETDLIEFKIWNQESDWINDLYLMEQKYENEKNNIYKFEFILLKVSKNKKINEVYDFILHIRMKYKKPAFFSKKLISIFADQADYKRSINESILFITESEKTNKISAITKNLIVDQIFEYLNKILINNQIHKNYLPITNKQLNSNLFLTINQNIAYEHTEIEYIIGIYNKLIQLNIRKDDSKLNLSDIYVNVFTDLDSAYLILDKLDNSTNINTYQSVITKKCNILLSKGYIDSALKVINEGNQKIEKFTNNQKKEAIKIKELEIALYKGDYTIFNQQLDSLIAQVKVNSNTYNDLLELKMISLYFANDSEKFTKYANILYKIKLNKSFESILELVELINDENILISELAHYQYALIELQKGNTLNTQKLIKQMKMKTIYSEISLIIDAEIEDKINKNYKNAIIFYESILEKYPNTIYKENILKRLNELNKLIIEKYDL